MRKYEDVFGGVAKLQNVRCIYCAQPLIRGTIEHVVGRKFVPTGTLNGSFNVLVKCCSVCNNAKSDLENDISAITQLPDVVGSFSHAHPEVFEESARKAKGSISRRTGLPVEVSSERITMAAETHSTRFEVMMTSPPQIDMHRAFALANLQVAGFVYWLTYDKASRVGARWRGGFYHTMMASRKDWGNAVHAAFMETVFSWPAQLVAPKIAKGFFKIAIRKHPTLDCCSWAIEWNHNYRLIGFFGNREDALSVHETFPRLKVSIMSGPEGRPVRYRKQSELASERDSMFAWGTLHDEISGRAS